MRNFLKVLCLGLFIGLPLVAGVAHGSPKAVVGELVYNLGDMPQGKPIQHDFIVKNTGDAPLTIQVKPC
jgi:hypothetical protein